MCALATNCAKVQALLPYPSRLDNRRRPGSAKEALISVFPAFACLPTPIERKRGTSSLDRIAHGSAMPSGREGAFSSGTVWGLRLAIQTPTQTIDCNVGSDCNLVGLLEGSTSDGVFRSFAVCATSTRKIATDERTRNDSLGPWYLLVAGCGIIQHGRMPTPQPGVL